MAIPLAARTCSSANPRVTRTPDAVASPVSRLQADYDGNVGLNTAAVAGKAIATGTGAYLSTGGAWVNASSRELKSDIRPLSADDALRALDGLQPVTFRYKSEDGETHAGFIAEEVPDLVATANRKGLGSMDVVAVLTQVVKQQKETIETQRQELDEVKGADRGARRNEGAARGAGGIEGTGDGVGP